MRRDLPAGGRDLSAWVVGRRRRSASSCALEPAEGLVSFARPRARTPGRRERAALKPARPNGSLSPPATTYSSSGAPAKPRPPSDQARARTGTSTTRAPNHHTRMRKPRSESLCSSLKREPFVFHVGGACLWQSPPRQGSGKCSKRLRRPHPRALGLLRSQITKEARERPNRPASGFSFLVLGRVMRRGGRGGRLLFERRPLTRDG